MLSCCVVYLRSLLLDIANDRNGMGHPMGRMVCFSYAKFLQEIEICKHLRRFLSPKTNKVSHIWADMRDFSWCCSTPTRTGTERTKNSSANHYTMEQSACCFVRRRCKSRNYFLFCKGMWCFSVLGQSITTLIIGILGVFERTDVACESVKSCSLNGAALEEATIGVDIEVLPV